MIWFLNYDYISLQLFEHFNNKVIISALSILLEFFSFLLGALSVHMGVRVSIWHFSLSLIILNHLLLQLPISP